MLRRAAAIPFAIVVALATTGWLYLYRPALPGPRVGEVLPLDELSKHGAASLVWFVLVWSAGAAAIGLYARAVRLEGVRAALLLATAVGAWTYLETGVSIAVVRQVSARAAF
ncbi:MAG TPA: hypothetical protein VJP39_03840, partial [Gaiellaceae bacterium]|nr:hypothetical protein [Gaiellaceae bacterium]